MFLNNKYTKWYYSIVNRGRSRVLPASIYTEKHHIIPKSLKGSNESNNIVILTAKEHFICHLLLTKMVTGKEKRSMWYACYMMCRGVERYKPTSRIYKICRENMVLANKERPGPNNGKILSEEHKKKISLATKGKPRGPKTEEHREKLRKPKTEEHKRNISKAKIGKSYGYRHKEETKEKMSSWQKGVTKPKVECEKCGNKFSILNYRRWHGPNCKLSLFD